MDDAGLKQGILISERLRTFAGKPLLVDRHLHRLMQGLRAVRIRLAESEIRQAIGQVIEHNFPLQPPGGDLQVSILVTPGTASPRTGKYSRTTLVVTSSPLPFRNFHRYYQSGIHLVSAENREIPGSCLPRFLKHRNRIHYWIAEQQAREAGDDDTRALLLDIDGNVCEATTASIACRLPDGRLVAPLAHQVLQGISLGYGSELAARVNHPLRRQVVSLVDLYTASEVLWFSSPMCLFPVTRVNGRPIAAGKPGTLFRQLIDAWSRESGIDLVAQAAQFANQPLPE